MDVFFLFFLKNLFLNLIPLSDFIKIERDDPIPSKGKGGDLNK